VLPGYVTPSFEAIWELSGEFCLEMFSIPVSQMKVKVF
jgi:hypothetical protein